MVLRYSVSTISPANPYSPVTVAMAKEHLEIPAAAEADDASLQRFISSATDTVQSFTSRQLLPATLKLQLARFPGPRCPISLPIHPISAINSINYIDGDDASQLLDSEDYHLIAGPPDLVWPTDGKWPEDHATLYAPEQVTVNFNAGAATAPNQAVMAILQLVHSAWEFRAAGTDRPITNVPFHTQVLLQQLDWGDEFEAYG